MSISKTTFRLVQVTEVGPVAFHSALQALREVLPYCIIECVQLNRAKFQINSSRYPRAIWQELLMKQEWHEKLIFHLLNSIAETDHARRMARQAEFAALVNAPDTRVTLYGSLLFESEGTPVMLEAAGLPISRSHGCELQVDAYTEFRKQAERDHGLRAASAVQQEIYRSVMVQDHEAAAGAAS